MEFSQIPLGNVTLAKSHLENPRSRWQGLKSQNRSSIDGVADCPSSLKKYVYDCICMHVHVHRCRYTYIYIYDIYIYLFMYIYLCRYINVKYMYMFKYIYVYRLSEYVYTVYI